MVPTPVRGAFCAAACFALLVPASAHVTLEQTGSAPGAAFRGVLKVNHGCKGAATTGLSITLPPVLDGVRPMPKPGWSLAVERGPAEGSGRPPVRTVTWTGGDLPDEFYDEFVFVGRVGAGVLPGTNLPVAVTQTCGATVVRWADEGGDTPAPRILVGAARPPAVEIRAGDLTVTTPWMRATPGGASVAGGFLSLTNRGREPDRLLAVTLDGAGGGEVHRTMTAEGVTRMAPVEGGIALAPGETVQLRPGGYHAMFTGLSRPLKEGETVSGTLTFARAGTVTVRYAVSGVGAAGPAGVGPAGVGPAGDEHRH